MQLLYKPLQIHNRWIHMDTYGNLDEDNEDGQMSTKCMGIIEKCYKMRCCLLFFHESSHFVEKNTCVEFNGYNLVDPGIRTKLYREKCFCWFGHGF